MKGPVLLKGITRLPTRELATTVIGLLLLAYWLSSYARLAQYLSLINNQQQCADLEPCTFYSWGQSIISTHLVMYVDILKSYWLRAIELTHKNSRDCTNFISVLSI
ncbi:hypothetical protein J6590_063288 [Homalodisca vitripennis]|nr:hypothetical protein J6590_063288 [Homalodisca vitripennis]